MRFTDLCLEMLRKGFFENKEKRKKINDALQQNSLENIYEGGTFPSNFANASMILILSKN